MREGKVVSLEAAAGLVADGSVISFGGDQIFRVPAAFVRELARQGKRGLRLYKSPPGYDADLLCAAGALSLTASGVISLERFGVAWHHRRAVESGVVKHLEHT